MLQAMQAACLALAFFVLPTAHAAETVVPPGLNTLASAVTAATPGDTLILQDGGYSGSTNLTIDKSLTIRASKRSTGAVIDLAMVVDRAGIDVTIQGLTFARSLYLAAGRSIRVLENTFVASAAIDPSLYRTTEGDGTLYVVGNRLLPGSNIEAVRADNSYIAGNVLSDGIITIQASVWVVGNDIKFRGRNAFNAWYQAAALQLSGSGISVRVLGNRITCIGGQNYCQGIGISNVPQTLVAGNVISILASYAGVSAGIGTEGSGIRDIRNNTIDGTGTTNGSSFGIWKATGGGATSVVGNSVTNFAGEAIAFPGNSTEIQGNLCFGNARPGGCSVAGNLDSDPAFQDKVDFRPSPGSPAIDAGPSDLAYADLDRTRNDIGAYGGPWSIGQYDAQRDPSNFAPYVYPLFNAGFVGGELEVEALGVARLR